MAQEYNLSLELMQDCLDPEHLPKLQRTGNMTWLPAGDFTDDCD